MTTFGRVQSVWTARIAPALVTPLGILLTVPILVGSVGLLIWWQGRVAVEASVNAMATRQFGERAEQGARHARDLLGHAGPLTDNMVAYVRRAGIDPPAEEFAFRFRDQLRACPGVAYISFGSREGHYFGVYRDAEQRFVLTYRRYGGPDRTHTREYHIGDDDSITLFSDDPAHGFDPRKRPWYPKSVENRRRTWSDPYIWFDIGVVGITCSEPIFDEQGETLAVTTVDFHLNALSAFIEGLATEEGSRTFVFTDALEVIAFPGARQAFGQGMEKGEKLMVSDLDDPVVQALFAARPSHDEDTPAQVSFDVAGEPYLAVLRPIRIGEDGRWIVATFGPTGPLTTPADAHERNALIVSAVALVLAIVFAAFFARHIVKTHLRIQRAETRAQEADDRAQRLGSYRLARKLGEGGMGEVWIAEHDMLARPAAIKLIRPSYLESLGADGRDVAVERFRREARVIAGLRSRNTIDIYDFGVADDGALFYVMELLDGIDLDELVSKHGPVPARRAVEILLQAASSLRDAHAHGVVHRDVKPANIFLCREAEELDVVKVLDFGMAQQLETSDPALTTEGEISGTPAFMAPEQVRGLAVDGRADVYALGCVGYWLVSGRPVFERDSAMAAAMAQVIDEPEPLGRAAPRGVPEALEDLVMRCLAKDPAARPAGMEPVVAELERIRDVLPADGWDPEACRTWWSRIPDRLGEAPVEQAPSVRLSPKRTV